MRMNAGETALREAFDEAVRANSNQYQGTEDFESFDVPPYDEVPPYDVHDEAAYDEEAHEDKRSKRRKKSGTDLQPFSAPDLLAKDFPEPKFIVPGYIGEGLTILAGRPKIGKSWLALNIAVAVAAGGVVLGSLQVEAGSVLYLALEDTQRRLQSRLKQVLGDDELPDDLYFATECPRLDEGAYEQLDRWVDSQENPRLIIIDVFNKVRPAAIGKESPYEADYRALGPLKAYADSRGVAVLILHHTRKMSAQDPFDTISGTTGFTGAADAAMVLASDEDGVSLYARGRDVEEIGTAVDFDRKTGRWIALGDREDVRRSEPRKVIIGLLESYLNQSMTISEISDRTGMERNNVKQLLHNMKHAGELITPRRGQYALPSYSDASDRDNDNSYNNFS
ncbi:AAA domain-containing protein [Bradyrhizobium huanghuaihaiense]|uniref:AAA domain-containing protein n=2 Tax=Bradyrhizobium huanghuaihaiense TaxID=990078 RepID=A0A562QVU4_9BRAD|nr:AAA domain-containing protein [Bradyrhizobium huanghuaihaiense]